MKPCIYCDFWYYHKLRLSWKFHSDSSSRSEDMKIISFNINYFCWCFEFFDTEKSTIKKSSLIGFNNLPFRIESIYQLFADNQWPLSKNNCNTQLNSNLRIISKYALHWMILFKPDKNKQAIDGCFSNKHKKVTDHWYLKVQMFNQLIFRNMYV